IHGSAMIQMNTGKVLSGSPSLGSWVNYGLGSENEDLPGYVVMLDPRGGPISGAKNWSSGYMPAQYEGTMFRTQGTPILVLARPLVERGVRFIQVYSGGNHNDQNWDAHGDLVMNHNLHAGETDKPIAGLLTDLKRRGLLGQTLIVWGGEFGRQPTAEYEKGTGRDHNAYGFTMWLAGGGIKGGVSVGATDELGSAAAESPFHVKHLHATILDRMGLDPERLTYFYG